MFRLSPAVWLRPLAYPYIGLVLLITANCTSELSIADLPAPVLPTQAAVAQVRLGPQAVLTLTPRPIIPPTAVPDMPAVPAKMPTQIITAASTQIPTEAPLATPTLIPTANAPGGPTRLIIPVINLDAPVVPMGWSVKEVNGQQVSEWDVPNWRAVGWLKTSAPLGAVGNTVLEGHNNIYGRIFEYLDDVHEGDTLQIYAGAVVRNYVVTQRIIVAEKGEPLSVRQENAKWIAAKDDERVTLITCHPRTSDEHRLILVAYPQPS